MIKVAMTSVHVDDVEKAHAFYTEVLGFETRTRLDMGSTLFVTVGASGGAQPDLALLLEPDDNPIARDYTAGLRAAGLPAIVFSVDDLRAEYARLTGLGVRFTGEPVPQGPVLVATLEDTVGNFVQLMQPLPDTQAPGSGG